MRKMAEKKGDDDGYDAISSPGNLGLVSGSRHVEASIISLSGTTDSDPKMDQIWFMYRLSQTLQIFSNDSNFCLQYKIQW